MTKCPRCHHNLKFNSCFAECQNCPKICERSWCVWNVESNLIKPEQYELRTNLYTILFSSYRFHANNKYSYDIYDLNFKSMFEKELPSGLYLLSNDQINDMIKTLIIFS
jgi:hypothetical protein